MLRFIGRRRDNIAEFLEKLVSLPSVTWDEWKIQNFIADKLRDMGLDIDMWEPDHEELKKHAAYVPVERGYEKRPNVVGVYRGAGNGRSLLFNGHVDVIPAGPKDAWSFDPFLAEIHEDRMYGRGSSDMKSCLAAMTMVLDYLIGVYA